MTEYLLSILMGVNVALWTVFVSCGIAVLVCVMGLDVHSRDSASCVALRKSRNRYFVIGMLAIVANAFVPTSGELVDAHNDRCKMAGEVCGK